MDWQQLQQLWAREQPQAAAAAQRWSDPNSHLRWRPTPARPRDPALVRRPPLTPPPIISPRLCSLDDIYEIARVMRDRSCAATFAGTVKEILGTAVSVGCTVEHEDPRDIQKKIDDGEVSLSREGREGGYKPRGKGTPGVMTANVAAVVMSRCVYHLPRPSSMATRLHGIAVLRGHLKGKGLRTTLTVSWSFSHPCHIVGGCAGCVSCIVTPSSSSLCNGQARSELQRPG